MVLLSARRSATDSGASRTGMAALSGIGRGAGGVSAGLAYATCTGRRTLSVPVDSGEFDLTWLMWEFAGAVRATTDPRQSASTRTVDGRPTPATARRTSLRSRPLREPQLPSMVA